VTGVAILATAVRQFTVANSLGQWTWIRSRTWAASSGCRKLDAVKPPVKKK